MVGALLILVLGTRLLQDPATEANPGVSLFLVAVSIGWLALAFFSQTAKAHWTLSMQGIEEQIQPRFAWLPLSPRGERVIHSSDILGWRLDETGVRAERRTVLLFELRGHQVLKIPARDREVDPAFMELVRFVEQWRT
jgi:hypothetical protein